MTTSSPVQPAPVPIGGVGAAPSPMADEERLKHLDFIQAAIGRLAQNCFLLKGWSVTLAGALFALAQQNTNLALGFVAVGSAVVMWGLDAEPSPRFHQSTPNTFRMTACS